MNGRRGRSAPGPIRVTPAPSVSATAAKGSPGKPAAAVAGPRIGGESIASCRGAYLSAPAVRPLTKRRCMATYSTVTGTDNTTTPAKM